MVDLPPDLLTSNFWENFAVVTTQMHHIIHFITIFRRTVWRDVSHFLTPVARTVLHPVSRSILTRGLLWLLLLLLLLFRFAGANLVEIPLLSTIITFPRARGIRVITPVLITRRINFQIIVGFKELHEMISYWCGTQCRPIIYIILSLSYIHAIKCKMQRITLLCQEVQK